MLNFSDYCNIIYKNCFVGKFKFFFAHKVKLISLTNPMMNENEKLMTANPLQIDTTFHMNWS